MSRTLSLNGRSLLRRLVQEESGQTIPFAAVMLLTLLSLTGFVVDVGRCLEAHRELQATTDAAALAGGSSLLTNNAVAVATEYSAVSGNLNASANLTGVTMASGYPKIVCLSTLTSEGMACASPSNGNAIQVRQQITFPLTLLRLVGLSSIQMTAEATASATGAARAPYNIAIIVDSTGSMNSIDSDSSCGSTRISCALAGVQILLQNLSPCAADLTTCGPATNGVVANPVDQVALYTFPGLSSSSQTQYDTDCSSSTKPSGSYYNESANSAIGSAPVNPPLYQIVPFSSDYRTSDATTQLNSASNLVKAVGGVSGCTGLQATIPLYTYFAGVIYAAGYDLYQQQLKYPGTQNVLILLGDGDANAPASNLPKASTTSGQFASSVSECKQAVDMAQLAYKSFNMRFYSVSYGAAPSGCSTDKATPTTPCATMQGMASLPQYFYSDYTASGASSNCIAASHSTTNLNTIFSQISGELSYSRLIPDDTT